MTDNKTVGLTGSTGAGKSEIARRMAAREHWAVIDADAISRLVVEKGQPTLALLTEHFSAAVLNPDGTLNRARLAALAFADPEKTAALNAIVHPAVIREIQAQRAAAVAAGKRVVVIDAPLLLQAGLDSDCDYTVAVTAPPEVRRARICARDGISAEAAAQRMSAQPGDDYYAARVSEVLTNDGDMAALAAKVEALCERIEAMV